MGDLQEAQNTTDHIQQQTLCGAIKAETFLYKHAGTA